jgi:hypothetical protein
MSLGWRAVNSPLNMAEDESVVEEAKRWMKLGKNHILGEAPFEAGRIS